jgi:hypothetical protein
MAQRKPKKKALTHRVQPVSPFHELNATPNVLRIR